MKNLRLSIKIAIAIAVLAGCAYAGRIEFNDTVLSGMSMEKYQFIRCRLDSRASENDVVREYIENQKYYDSISY